MSSPLSSRFTIGPATGADAAAVAAVARAVEVALHGTPQIDEGDILDWWRTVDQERDTWVARDDGTVVAAATLWKHGDVPNVWADVHPDAVGHGLGSALLDLTESRARELGAPAIRNDVFGRDEPARRLLERRGYRIVRRYFEMRIELGDEPPAEPTWPEVLRVEQFQLDDARAVHDALGDAFREEWGWAPMEFEEWRRIRLEADDFDPSLWSVVWDGDEVAAVARCDRFRYGGGWIQTLGVRKPWRRRGLGLALLQHTFRLFHARGERSIGLGVDTENPTGALSLYERAGMHVHLETVTYEIALS
jgi:ribosomal protein S18 acetylase RimI-like enzyme